MKPVTVSIVGGITGLILGFLFLPDINGAPVFAALLFGFVSYQVAWALGTIRDTKTLGTRSKNDVEERDKDINEG